MDLRGVLYPVTAILCARRNNSPLPLGLLIIRSLVEYNRKSNGSRGTCKRQTLIEIPRLVGHVDSRI